MNITSIVKEDGSLEQVIVTSSGELVEVIRKIIVHDMMEGQVNIHIQDNGQVYITKPQYKN
jgi:hemin uptake protein HemP